MTVLNSAPLFEKEKPKNLIMNFKTEMTYKLPKYIDIEKNAITLDQVLPSFVTFDSISSMYFFKPTDPAMHIGTFTIEGTLKDFQLSNPFSFTITVIKKPPGFSGGKKLKDLTVIQGTEYEYQMPPSEDEAGMPYKTIITLGDGSPLPSFINYNPTE